MSILEILTALRANNIVPSAEGGQLMLSGNTDLLPDDLIATIKSRKKELLAFLQAAIGNGDPEPILPVAAQQHYPASNAQKRIWLQCQLEVAQTAYNLVKGLHVDRDLDETLLEQSLQRMIARHESLRTIFRESEGEIRQVILKEAAIAIDSSFIADPSGVGNLLQQALKQAFEHVFNLENGPLINIRLLHLPDNATVLVLCMHHIISDGWSAGLLLKELLLEYDTEPAIAVQPLGIQYKDYTAWQESRWTGELGAAAANFWKNEFVSLPEALNLPTDFLRPDRKSFKGAISRFYPGETLQKDITLFCRHHQVTLFNFYRSCLTILLQQYSGQDDITIGVPVSGRGHKQLEDQIGMYVNTLPLRMEMDTTETFLLFLQRVMAHSNSALVYQDYPFDEIVDSIDCKWDVNRNPLFDVMMVLQQVPVAAGSDINKISSVEKYIYGGDIMEELPASAKFDLSFNFDFEPDGEAYLDIEYATDLFDKKKIRQLYHSWLSLVKVVMADPGILLSDITVVDDAEAICLLETFNNTAAGFRQDVTLIGLFGERVAATPEKTALVFQKKSFTYSQLNIMANRLGGYLREHYQVCPDDLVAVKLPRSEWLIISILGILKSGAAYVPIDPDFPEERIDYIRKDSNCKVLIDEQELKRFISVSASYSATDLPLVNTPDDLAYVIYTSGSTGRPKGCMLRNRGVVNRIEWMWAHYGYTDNDVILQKTTCTFDVSVWELFIPLCLGGRMVLCQQADTWSPERLLLLIEQEKVTNLHFVPAMLFTFITDVMQRENVPHRLRSLRCIMTSGEALPLSTVKAWYNLVQVPLYNLYGPTEASVDVTWYTTAATDTIIPIGRPIWNTQMYVLGKCNQLLPVGVTGEICIGGIGLAKGYLNKPELTTEKFVPNPFRPGERMYKTGDLGRWLPDGNIEYIGRRDDQLKIRGYRIEAGEIEAVLQSHPDIETAVVTAWLTPQQDKELVAYLVTGKQLLTNDLTAFLGHVLPSYMIPYYYVTLDALPLSPNGKIDRRQLPSPVPSMLSSATYEAPVNAVQLTLVQLWEELLNRSQVGIRDDFFKLGGHSLKATRLVSRIYKQLEVKIGVKDVFLHPVLEDLAALILSLQQTSYAEIPLAAPAESYPLSSSQRRLWVISQLEGGNAAYNMPGVYVFEGVLSAAALAAAFQALIVRHEILRTVFREDVSGEVRQYILDEDNTGFVLQEEDLRIYADTTAPLKKALDTIALAPFSLSEGPLLRACLYHLSDYKWVFACTMHHIVSDGWSMGIMIAELLQHYNASVEGAALSAAPLKLQYKDYAVWQQQQLLGPLLGMHRSYWHQQLDGDLPVLDLPVDTPRSAAKSYRCGSVTHTISKELTAGLKKLCVSNHSTVFMGLLSCVNALLYRYTGQDDIIIGCPVAGREHADLEDQIGFYVNTLALRARFDGDSSFLELLQHIRQITMEAYTHQLYPFDMLVDELKVLRDASRNPLFDVMVVLQDATEEEMRLPSLNGISVTHYQEDTVRASKFDLLFSFRETAGTLQLTMDYNSDLYNIDKIAQMGRHLEQLLTAVLAGPEIKLATLSYLGVAEAAQLLGTFSKIINGYKPRKDLAVMMQQRGYAGIRTYIVDEHLQLLPVGIKGEICIALMPEDKTGATELPPAHPDFKGRLFRTGDLGVRLADGEIAFSVRKEDLVYIHGCKVDITAVEAVLLSFPGVTAAMVKALKVSADNTVLLAYLQSSMEFQAAAVKSFLSAVLPAAMVPQYYIGLDELPLDEEGLPDRSKLPLPAPEQLSGLEWYAPPENEVQEKLLEIWTGLLFREKISIYDHFFELGGHSLKATRLVNLIYKTFEVKVGLDEIFKHPVLADLAALIDAAMHTGFVAIPMATPQESYALSPAQRRLWVVCQLEEASVAYNMAGAYVLEGDLQQPILQAAFHALVDRHEILRTVFRDDEAGNIRQYILEADQPDYHIPETDFRMSADVDASVKEAVLAGGLQPFSLSAGPLVRLALYRQAADKWVLGCTIHHIISDGWSMEIMIRELLEYYNAGVSGRTLLLPPLRIQYKDYSVWQQQLSLQSSEERLYWLKQFEGEIPVLQLPTDKARPQVKSYRGQTICKMIPGDLFNRFSSLLQREKDTLFMGLLSLVNVLLYRYTGQDDIITGSPVAGRRHPDLEGQIGFYVNLLAWRTRLTEEDNYLSLLEKVKDTVLKGLNYQEYPFDALVEELPLPRSTNRSPLFDVLLVLQQSSGEEESGGVAGMTVKDYGRQEQQISKFDISFCFTTANDELQLLLEYDDSLFTKMTADRIGDHVIQLMNAVTEDPGLQLKQLSYLTVPEKEQLLNTFNDTAAPFPAGQTIAALFEEQARLTPDKTALVFEDVRLTYRELRDRANRLAVVLNRQYDINPDDLIAVKLKRSEMLIVTIIAILRTGAAYLPVDMDYPEELIGYMISDSNCIALIDEEWLSEHEAGVALPEAEVLPVRGESHHLAYVMYTSGSTGKPKGVMVENRSVVRLVKYENYAGLTGTEVLLSTGALSFDATTFEYWGMLLNGGCLVLCSQETLLDNSLLHTVITGEKVNIMWFTAGWFNQLADSYPIVFSGLNKILTGGDKISPVHVNKLLQEYPLLDVINGYGPTENTTFSLTYRVQAGEVEIPIGKPVSNSTVYVLDDQLKLVPVGITGEICVGGAGLARGYLNKPDLTAEKFIPNPYCPGELMYKTGDLGRWRPDGNIEFLGRKDDQLKIRGYRIEAGEIETILESHPDINAALVTAWLTPQGDKELVAYVVGSRPLEAGALTAYLGNILPAYMVPYYYVPLDALPLSPNGKVDRRQLPSPATAALASDTVYQPPVNPVQSTLVELWQELLNRSRVGIHDDFFRLGGHSLKATRLISQVYKTLEVKIGLKDVFLHPVLEDLAALIMSLQHTAYAEIPLAPPSLCYPLSSSQRRLWVISQLEGGNEAYNIPGVYVFEGALNITALATSFHALIARHEVLHTVFREDASGEICQYILDLDNTGFQLQEVDLRACADADEQLRQALDGMALKPFSLSDGPLLRACLYRMADDRWVFACTMHHIVSDGWSMGIMIEELLQGYHAAATGASLSLPPLRLQYKDYAVWQQQQLSGPLLAAQRSYWHQQLEGDLPVLELPVDKVRSVVKSYTGGNVKHVFSREQAAGLKTLCVNNGSTLFMGLLACVNTLLYRYTGQEDIIVGSPVAGREHTDLEDQIGFYVNTLALRARFDGNDSFLRLLHHIRQVTMEAYTHQQYPFDMLVDELDLPRDTSRNPLFNVMVILQNNERVQPQAFQQLVDLRATPYASDGFTISKFDLLLGFMETAEGLLLEIEYSRDLYEHETIERMVTHLEQLLEDIILHPVKSLYELKLLPEQESRLLREVFNKPQTAPDERTIVDLFRKQAACTPDNPAIVSGSDIVTYASLDETSNRFAHYLLHHYRIVPDSLVAVKMERNPAFVITVLAIIKTGAAYMPVDISCPEERLKLLEEDSNCITIIDDDFYAAAVAALPGFAGTAPEVALTADQLLYLIYTSGSTGIPKGIMMPHRSMVNLMLYHTGLFPDNEVTKVSLLANVGFDVSFQEIFSTLLRGAVLYPVEEDVKKDPVALTDFIVRHRIDTVFLPTAYFKLLAEDDYFLDNVRNVVKHVIVAGEQLILSESFIQYLQESEWELHNHYGPAETHVVTVLRMGRDNASGMQRLPTIGKPVDNSQIYILDNHHQLCPVSVIGEICIGGAAVARGYLNKTDLTAEKFVDDPFFPGRKMYKTGDLGRWLPDGNIAYTGRRDGQLKVRGYRVEPGEIETTLLSWPGIESVAVQLFPGAKGEAELVAYMVSATTIPVPEIRVFLEERLPAYMVPYFYLQIPELPLTANGKTDRSKLPLPAVDDYLTNSRQIAPRNSTEEKLVVIWRQLLGREKISVHDHFFEMGGHSLKATRLVSQIYKTFEVKIGLKDIFAHPSIEAQAIMIQSARRAAFDPILPAPEADSYPLSEVQRRLWIMSRFEGANAAYNMPGVFKFEGKLDYTALENAFSRLIARHESLRTVFREDGSGEVKQFILDPAATGFRIIYENLNNLVDNEAGLNEIIRKEAMRPFSLATGPLLRAALYRIASNRWIFVYTMHHIVSDGWSMNILIKELMNCYNAHVAGKEWKLPPLAIQYKDYTLWQLQQLSGSQGDIYRSYWLKQLEGPLPLLELPADSTRAAVRSFQGNVVYHFFQEKEIVALKSLCLNHDSTLFMGLLALVNTLLYRYSGQTDIIMGTPVAGREHVDLEHQIGFYVNTLALRSRFAGNNSFEELLQHTRQITLEAYSYQAYPFDTLVNELNIARDTSRNPLFDVMIILQNNDKSYIETVKDAGELLIDNYPYHERAFSKFDLTFDFIELPGGLQLTLTYDKGLFHEQRMKDMSRHMATLLSAVLDDPASPLEHFDLLTAAEKLNAIATAKEQPYSFNPKNTFQYTLDSYAAEIPTALIAVEGGRTIALAALQQQSGSFCSYLKDHCHLKPEHIVEVQLEDPLLRAVAVAAVTRAGATLLLRETPDSMPLPAVKEVKIINTALVKGWLLQKEKYGIADVVPVHPAHPVITLCTLENSLVIKYDTAVNQLFWSGATEWEQGIAAMQCWVQQDFHRMVTTFYAGLKMKQTPDIPTDAAIQDTFNAAISEEF
ncbi:amino acid adenylation domain-containing protein [Chitinophaga eiseniae]|uniref:Amino acid adenylation domain-containing protein n=1 Tax=Chitinophaga eiseniae TaxID=634771 RepID=A0A1T4U5R7_9BACT|nr:non-ribosomal peptide synthetase [Chitinophaga eiseniae]SKA47939.1 amino acid adenylation domain-containing protein [Chitinophaga eiseniae]